MTSASGILADWYTGIFLVTFSDWYTGGLVYAFLNDWHTEAYWCDWYTVGLVYFNTLVYRWTGILVFCEPLFTLPLINFVYILCHKLTLFIYFVIDFFLFVEASYLFPFVYSFSHFCLCL